jgi:hypothetical protein
MPNFIVIFRPNVHKPGSSGPVDIAIRLNVKETFDTFSMSHQPEQFALPHVIMADFREL